MESNSSNENDSIIKNKRGRKSINKNNSDNIKKNNISNTNQDSNEIKNIESSKIPKKRGRKPKNQEQSNTPQIDKTPKKRGRKPQSKIYSINKNNSNEIQPNLTSNLILHLKINKIKLKKEEIVKNHFEDSFLDYSPGINIPQPYDPNNNDIGSNFKSKDLNNEHNDTKFATVSVDYSKKNLNNAAILSNLDIQLKERRIYTCLQQFIDDWPISTDVSCFWCCHQFDNTPCSIPESYHNNLFKVNGCFCSFNCATSYLFSNEKNSNSLWEKYSTLHLLKNKLLNNNDSNFIKPAPPRESLKSFGGYLTINEFRNNSDKLYNIVSPPVIILCPQIDESSYNNEIKTSNKKFIPVDQNKMNKADQSFRLKRNKPLPNHRMSLENLLESK
jgi:hypothetical protein